MLGKKDTYKYFLATARKPGRQCIVSGYLLDVVAVTRDARAGPAFAATLAPLPHSLVDPKANSETSLFMACCLLRNRIVPMNANKMAAEVMFTAERASASGVMASVWLGTVRVVCCHVCLEVIGTGEGCKSSMSMEWETF